MKKIVKQKDSWGEYVVYVSKCDKYEYENPEIPPMPLSDLHNMEMLRIHDIIDAVEDYFYDSGK